MAKRQSLIEDLFDLIAYACFYLPSWAIPVIAIGLSGGSYWAVDHFVNSFEAYFTGDLGNQLRFFIPIGVFIVTLLAGIKGKLKRNQRQALLKQTNTLDELKALSWHEFELLIAETYRSEGYSVTEMGGSGPDGGIDLTATAPNGAHHLIQCKHYKTSKVGVKIVREILGVLAKEGGHQAVVIATGAYTKDAIKFAQGQPIELIDGPHLIERIQAYKAQTPRATATTAAVTKQPVQPAKEVPTTTAAATTTTTTAPPRTTMEEPTTTVAAPCPKCGSGLVERTAKRGPNAGNTFLGCSNFPKCRYTA
jgi:restriction system protein